MPLDLTEALRDPGYPGFHDDRVRRFAFFKPLARLSACDLDRFWLLEYRWPHGATPLGLMFIEDGLQWAGQYAAWRVPLPPSNGIDYRLVGTHFYSAELPQPSTF